MTAKMRAVLPILAIGIVVAVAGFLYFEPLRDADAEYQRANESILALLVHPAGATEVSRDQNASYEEGVSWLLKDASGWTLRVVYHAPDGMNSEQALAFYRDNVPAGWQAEVQEIPIIDIPTGNQTGVTRSILYTKDDAVVAISFDNLNEGGPGTYEMGINQKARNGSSPMATPSS